MTGSAVFRFIPRDVFKNLFGKLKLLYFGDLCLVSFIDGDERFKHIAINELFAGLPRKLDLFDNSLEVFWLLRVVLKSIIILYFWQFSVDDLLSQLLVWYPEKLSIDLFQNLIEDQGEIDSFIEIFMVLGEDRSVVFPFQPMSEDAMIGLVCISATSDGLRFLQLLHFVLLWRRCWYLWVVILIAWSILDEKTVLREVLVEFREPILMNIIQHIYVIFLHISLNKYDL